MFRFLPAAVVLLALSGAAAAQSAEHGHAMAASAPAAAAPAADGEVRKVDTAQGKLTLRHGRIENLDMPAMTMVFRVADPKMLSQLKVGDKVKFAADNVNGALTVTAIEPAK
ncbi:MAG: copper-binding protein [Piscinibacter sp.]|nr:copper-binding protein [Piscinibacter sp.]